MQAKVHPSADAFPMMSAEQYEGLKSDIAERGQQEAIVYWQGELVDGRNRLKACRELKLDPIECELDESVDPVAYVISANLHRRHLTTAQRAMVAAKLATLKKGGDRKTDDFKPPFGGLISEAATLLQTSERSVGRAKHIVTNGSKDLIQAVERGEVNLNQATKLVKSTPDKREQSKIVREGKDAVKAASRDDGKLSRPKRECDAVTAFKQSDQRLETLKRIVAILEPHEKEFLAELVGVKS